MAQWQGRRDVQTKSSKEESAGDIWSSGNELGKRNELGKQEA